MNEAVFDRDILLDALHGLGGQTRSLPVFPAALSVA
jgi:hypothetical protein